MQNFVKQIKTLLYWLQTTNKTAEKFQTPIICCKLYCEISHAAVVCNSKTLSLTNGYLMLLGDKSVFAG